MKTLFFCLITLTLGSHLVYGQNDSTKELKNLTVGLGAGYNYQFKNLYSYSLSTDTTFGLKSQELSKFNFVISSVITFRFGNPYLTDENRFQKKPDYNRKGEQKMDGDGNPVKSVPFQDRLSLNLSINLVNVGSDGVDFNKQIDGGIGLGVFFNPYVQLGVFLEIARVRQLRDHVWNSYQNQPIPKGSEFYNALDQNDDQLFYTTSVPSLSVKAIFTIPNED